MKKKWADTPSKIIHFGPEIPPPPPPLSSSIIYCTVTIIDVYNVSNLSLSKVTVTIIQVHKLKENNMPVAELNKKFSVTKLEI